LDQNKSEYLQWGGDGVVATKERLAVSWVQFRRARIGFNADETCRRGIVDRVKPLVDHVTFLIPVGVRGKRLAIIVELIVDAVYEGWIVTGITCIFNCRHSLLFGPEFVFELEVLCLALTVNAFLLFWQEFAVLVMFGDACRDWVVVLAATRTGGVTTGG